MDFASRKKFFKKSLASDDSQVLAELLRRLNAGEIPEAAREGVLRRINTLRSRIQASTPRLSAPSAVTPAQNVSALARVPSPGALATVPEATAVAETAAAIEATAGAAAGGTSIGIGGFLSVLATGVAAFATTMQTLNYITEKTNDVSQNSKEAGAALRLALSGSNDLTDQQKTMMGPQGFLGNQFSAIQAAKLMINTGKEVIPDLTKKIIDLRANPKSDSSLQSLGNDVKKLEDTLKLYEEKRNRWATAQGAVSMDEFYQLCKQQSSGIAAGLGVSNFADAGNKAKAAEDTLKLLVEAIDKNIVPKIHDIIDAYNLLMGSGKPGAAPAPSATKPRPRPRATNNKIYNLQKAFNEFMSENPDFFKKRVGSGKMWYVDVFEKNNMSYDDVKSIIHTPDNMMGPKTRAIIALVGSMMPSTLAQFANLDKAWKAYTSKSEKDEQFEKEKEFVDVEPQVPETAPEEELPFTTRTMLYVDTSRMIKVAKLLFAKYN